MSLNDFLETIGFSRHTGNYRDQLVSAAGGFVGILCIFIISQWLLDAETAVLIVPSMGASAVLLFAAPHAPFSQPWNVLGGHAISAVIGIACWRWIPSPAIAASAAVGLAIGAMYFARCIHPPGGATALAAVIGSEKLHAAGFAYLFEPILLNATIILLAAILFNNLFKWRRYPARRQGKTEMEKPAAREYGPIRHEDFVYALSHIDTFVDISEEDLLNIYRLATRRQVAPDQV
jgi:CBS domain-containing membrane protein